LDDSDTGNAHPAIITHQTGSLSKPMRVYFSICMSKHRTSCRRQRWAELEELVCAPVTL